MVYNCQVLVGSDSLAWSLPNGETQDLRFNVGSPNGAVRTSEDGNFIATLTSRTGQDLNVMFNSTLMIREVMNYSMNLTCTAAIGGGAVTRTTMIVVSGKVTFISSGILHIRHISIREMHILISYLKYHVLLLLVSGILIHTTYRYPRPSL